MSDDNQILIPPSFIALYVPEGHHRPTLPRDDIAARHEFCEDLATALTEQAGALLWQLGITERDVLERVARGLAAPESQLSPPEAHWVLCRLAELLEWPLPAGTIAPPESRALQKKT